MVKNISRRKLILVSPKASINYKNMFLFIILYYLPILPDQYTLAPKLWTFRKLNLMNLRRIKTKSTDFSDFV